MVLYSTNNPLFKWLEINGFFKIILKKNNCSFFQSFLIKFLVQNNRKQRPTSINEILAFIKW
jgi:hypothetical protein